MIQSNNGNKADRSSKHNGNLMFYLKMFLPNIKMVYSELVLPCARALYSVLEHFTLKLVLFIGAGGLSELLNLELFDTPVMWWKGLLYLVIIDWISGVAIALIDGRFSWSTLNEKWRQIIGYVAVCAMAAILANGFPNIFYYFQFLIYVSFFIKEAISILKTFKLLAFVQVVRQRLVNGEGEFFDGTLTEEVKKQAEKNKETKPNINIDIEKEPYEEP